MSFARKFLVLINIASFFGAFNFQELAIHVQILSHDYTEVYLLNVSDAIRPKVSMIGESEISCQSIFYLKAHGNHATTSVCLAHFYGLATPSPDSQTKSCQTEPDEKVAGSVWLPGPKVCRKLEGKWPDCTRQRQNFTLF